jgi:hypothetical protein
LVEDIRNCPVAVIGEGTLGRASRGGRRPEQKAAATNYFADSLPKLL